MSDVAGVLPFVVIPANAGIQPLTSTAAQRPRQQQQLDPGIRRDDEKVVGQ